VTNPTYLYSPNVIRDIRYIWITLNFIGTTESTKALSVIGIHKYLGDSHSG